MNCLYLYYIYVYIYTHIRTYNKSNTMHATEVVCICNNLLHVSATQVAIVREAVQRITKDGTIIEVMGTIQDINDKGKIIVSKTKDKMSL